MECDRYEEERGRLIGCIIRTVGREEWLRRLEEEEGGILTVLGLYRGEGQREKEQIVRAVKEFLVQAWERRGE